MLTPEFANHVILLPPEGLLTFVGAVDPIGLGDWERFSANPASSPTQRDIPLEFLALIAFHGFYLDEMIQRIVVVSLVYPKKV
jgi:hypothetical protein